MLEKSTELSLHAKGHAVIDMKDDIDISIENETNQEYFHQLGQDLEFNSDLQKLSNERTFSCDECGYESKYKKDLKKHKLSKHKGFRVECDQCEKSFFDISTLNKHKKTKHFD